MSMHARVKWRQVVLLAVALHALVACVLQLVHPAGRHRSCCLVAAQYTTIQSPYGGVVSSLGIFGADGAVHFYRNTTSGIETVYYTQPADHMLMSMDPSNGFPTILAGDSGTSGNRNGIGTVAQFSSPKGIASEKNGILFIADTGNHCIRRYDPSTRRVSTFAGVCSGTSGYLDGNAETAQFAGPVGIAWDGNQFLYVCDQRNNLIRRVDSTTGDVITVAGNASAGRSGHKNGAALSALFFYPTGIVVQQNAIVGSSVMFITDMYNHVVRRLVVGLSGASGVVSTVAGSFSTLRDGVGTAVSFTSPKGIAFSADRSVLYVADSGNCAIRRLEVSSAAVTTLSGLAGCVGFANAIVDGVVRSARFYQVSSIAYYRRAVLPPTSGVATEEQGLFVMDSPMMREVTIWPPTATQSVSKTRASASLSDRGRGSSVSAATYSAPTATHSSMSTRSDTHSPSRRHFSDSEGNSASMSNHTTTRSITTSAAISRSASGTSVCGPLSASNVTLHRGNAVLLAATGGWHNITSSQFRRLVVVDPTSTTDSDAQHRVAPPTAVPLPRIAVIALDLVDEAALFLNLSIRGDVALSGVALWRVAAVSHRLTSVPQLVAHNFTTVDVPTMAGEAFAVATHPIVVHPPRTQSWMHGVGLFESSTITLVVTVQCAAAMSYTVDIAIEIPAPAPTRELAEEVRTATTTLQWASVVASVGAGGSVGRVAAIRSVALCSGGGDDGSGDGGGLLSLRISNGGGSACHGNDGARGAVIGNLSLLVGGAVLMTLVCIAHALLLRGGGRQTTKSFVQAARRFSAPSSLIPLCVVLVPSTAGGVVRLASSAPTTGGCAADVAVVLVGGVLCVLPVLGVVVTVVRVLPALVCANVPFVLQRGVDGAAPSRWSLWWGSVVRLLGPVFHRTWQWQPQRRHGDASCAAGMPKRDGDAARHRQRRRLSAAAVPTGTQRPVGGHIGGTEAAEGDSSRHAQTLLLEYRVVWFAGVDAAVLVAAGGLGAASSLSGRRDTCVAAAATIVALYALELIACVVVTPFTTLFAHQHTVLTLALSTGSIALQLASVASDANDLELQSALLQGAAACDLCVIGVSSVRIAMDVGDMAKSLFKLVRSFVGSARGQTMDGAAPISIHAIDAMSDRKDGGPVPPLPLLIYTDDSCDDDGGDAPPTPVRSNDSSVTSTNASMSALERRFWDAEGNARKSSHSSSLSFADDAAARAGGGHGIVFGGGGDYVL